MWDVCSTTHGAPCRTNSKFNYWVLVHSKTNWSYRHDITANVTATTHNTPLCTACCCRKHVRTGNSFVELHCCRWQCKLDTHYMPEIRDVMTLKRRQAKAGIDMDSTISTPSCLNSLEPISVTGDPQLWIKSHKYNDCSKRPRAMRWRRTAYSSHRCHVHGCRKCWLKRPPVPSTTRHTHHGVFPCLLDHSHSIWRLLLQNNCMSGTLLVLSYTHVKRDMINQMASPVMQPTWKQHCHP